MIKFFHGEEWMEIRFTFNSNLKYALSNFGRLVSYSNTIKEGRILKCSNTKGYKVFKKPYFEEGKKKVKCFYIHKLVAELFLPPKRDDQTFVIHLNFVKDNNHISNLQWASKYEVEEHQSKNPRVIEDRKRLLQHNKLNEFKLDEAKVKILKRKLADPKRKTRLKMLARQFGISEMQLHRIKTGENWGHVKI